MPMPEPTLAYFVGIVAGFFIGAVACALISSTSPDDIDIESPTDDTSDTNAGAGPFALCAGCGRIAPRDTQIRLCPKCAPPPDAIGDLVTETEHEYE